MKSFIHSIAICSLLFLLGCNNNSGSGEAYASADTTSVSGLTGDAVKLVKTASLRVKVKNVQQASRAVSALARELGGMISHQQFQASETDSKALSISEDSLLTVTTFNPVSDITLRIPSERLEDFLYRVSELGYFTSDAILDIDDKSLDYLQHGLRQNNRTAVLSAQPARKSNISAVLRTIDVKDQITDQQMANRLIDGQVNFSTVSLHLFQNAVVRKEVIANYVVSDYELPFGQRMNTAIGNGWHYFLRLLLVIANLWTFITVTIIAYFSYRYIQHKKKI